MDANRCVCCGDIIPEGRMTCPMCEQGKTRMDNNITKDIWKQIRGVLEKYKIPYTTHYTKRDVEQVMEKPPIEVSDKHIQINLTIPNYFEEGK